MSRTKRWILGLAVACCCASPQLIVAQPQTLASTPPGERIQLTLRDSLRQRPLMPARQMVVGQFVRATEDSVWIRPYGASRIALARQNIRYARVSRGTSRLRSALVLGASWGFSFAAAVAIDQLDENHDHKGRDALVGAGVGFGAGALIGTALPFEHWRRIRR